MFSHQAKKLGVYPKFIFYFFNNYNIYLFQCKYIFLTIFRQIYELLFEIDLYLFSGISSLENMMYKISILIIVYLLYIYIYTVYMDTEH